MATIGERLRKLLGETGLKQKEAAKLLNMKVTTFSGYVNDYREADIDVLTTLADFFGVSLDYLTGRTDQRLTPIRGFIGKNIDIVKGKMSYKELSIDIGKKLNNQTYSKMLNPTCLEDLANGTVKPTSNYVRLLAQYAGVMKDFFYRNNTYADYCQAQQEFLIKVESQRIEHLDDDLNAFVRDPNSTSYIVLAAQLREKGIDVDVVGELTEDQEGYYNFIKLYNKLKEKSIDPDDIRGFTLKKINL